MLIRNTRYTWFSDYNVLNTKISKIEIKIPNTSSLVTITVLNTNISKVEKKISNHDKYITTPEFNKLAAENFTARLEQINLVTKLILTKNQQALIEKLPQIKQNI